jgi:hypothetical protein
MSHEADAAAKILASKGSKLHTHEMHIRRTKNGYVAKHDLRDSKGQPPQDGQDGQAEYNMSNPAELAAHVQQSMGPVEPDDPQQEMNAAAGQ